MNILNKLNTLPLLTLALTSSYVSAASPASHFSSVNLAPAQVMKNLDQHPRQKKRTQTELVNDDTASSLPNKKSSAATAHFMLQSVQIKGAPDKSLPALNALTQAAVNHDVTLADLQNLAQTMQTTLRDQGYILASVILPPQTIQKKLGQVQFQVIPGYIAQVRISGDQTHGATHPLQAYAQNLEQQNPTTLTELEYQLTLMNELPGIEAQGVLSPSNTPGAADLDIQVKQTPVSSYIGYNNRGTDYIGPNQILAGFNINDILTADRLSVNYATSWPHPTELNYFNTSYAMIPAWGSGTKITPSITYTHTRPGQELSSFDMVGQSTRYALDISQPLLRGSTQNISFLSGIYHLESENNLLGFQIYQDKISAFKLGLNYNGLLLDGTNDATAFITQGFNALGSHSTEAAPSRFEGRPDFTKFNFDLSHTHYLNSAISIFAATSLQYSNNPLLVSEQIGYGGSTFGQAYDPSEIIGDSGLMGAVALRYDLPQSFSGLPLLQPFVFYDAGKVWTNATSIQGMTSQSGASTGLGVNANLNQTWQTTVTLAYPLTLTPQEQSHKSWRAFFSIVGLF